MTAQALLAAERLTKKYGKVVALDDVSFTIHEGITGILGENGAGKSTAIKIFLSLLKPTAGKALVLGESAHDDARVRARLGRPGRRRGRPRVVDPSSHPGQRPGPPNREIYRQLGR
ncbi:MAG: ATP-binding cassette domain-containing protein [Lacisediminihabitans sp.]